MRVYIYSDPSERQGKPALSEETRDSIKRANFFTLQKRHAEFLDDPSAENFGNLRQAMLWYQDIHKNYVLEGGDK